MGKLYENIRTYRNALGMSQEELAQKTGYRSRTSIAKIEKGLVDLPESKLDLFAVALGVSRGELVGKGSEYTFPDIDEADYPQKATTINVYGTVSAGIPLEMIEDIIDTEDIPEKMSKTGKFFGLRIKGDSMTPAICDGDVVIVRQQDDAETGDIVIATVNGEEATCKRLRKYKDGIELIAINPSYQSYEFSNAEILQKPVKILGKVVESRRKF